MYIAVCNYSELLYIMKSTKVQTLGAFIATKISLLYSVCNQKILAPLILVGYTIS